MKTRHILLLGMGNDILRDDGIGLYVVREAAQWIPTSWPLTVKETTLSGLNLLELVDGYSDLYLADAIPAPDLSPGSLVDFTVDRQMGLSLRLSFLHDADIFTVMAFGRRLGYDMPRLREIFAIAVSDPWTLDERCSADLERQIPSLAHRILQTIGRNHGLPMTFPPELGDHPPPSVAYPGKTG